MCVAPCTRLVLQCWPSGIPCSSTWISHWDTEDWLSATSPCFIRLMLSASKLYKRTILSLTIYTTIHISLCTSVIFHRKCNSLDVSLTYKLSLLSTARSLTTLSSLYGLCMDLLNTLHCGFSMRPRRLLQWIQCIPWAHWGHCVIMSLMRASAKLMRIFVSIFLEHRPDSNIHICIQSWL